MFRPFLFSDKEDLIKIFRLLVPKYFDASEEQEFLNYLADKSDTYLAIEQDNKIVGGLGYEIRESDQSGRINWIFLHPDWSGSGLGRTAVEYCQNLLKSDPRVKKLVVRTSQLVFPFFEKLGYKVVLTEKDYWAKGLDLYLMEKEFL